MISFIISVVPAKHHLTSHGRWALASAELGWRETVRQIRPIAVIPSYREGA
jgi:hypothetical protein